MNYIFTHESNPGFLKLPVEQIYAGNETKARNQRIQNMLRMIGFGENRGSGFPLILSVWNEKHRLKPDLFEQPELMQVKLVLTIDTKIDKDNGTKEGGTKDGTKDGIKELTERQEVVLDYIKQDGTLTSFDLTQKTGMSQRTIMRELAELQEIGVLLREGGHKEGRWVIVSKKDDGNV